MNIVNQIDLIIENMESQNLIPRSLILTEEDFSAFVDRMIKLDEVKKKEYLKYRELDVFYGKYPISIVTTRNILENNDDGTPWYKGIRSFELWENKEI